MRSVAIALCLYAPVAAWSESTPTSHEHMHGASAPKLTQPGNDVFGAIQEVLRQLEADPHTDWKKVNLEALRQHLLDMRNFTENVEIVSQKSIENGVEIVVRPTVVSAIPSLDRAFAAHPAQLKSETGWDMTVKKEMDRYTLRIVAADAQQADKIRGLGYIGIMAYGDHHPAHHWALATGQPMPR